jgi:hypothetical protein
MTTEKSQSKSAAAPKAGFKKKNLIVFGLVFVGYWALAIASGSPIFMGVSGFLTVLLAAVAFWVWLQMRSHKKLASVLEGAGESPEARKLALETLEADKNSGNLINVIARAQLLASEEPAQALALLEPIEIKTVPANAQDDFSLLKSQLLLSFGRVKQARPLVDRINVDNPERQEMRPFMVAIVGETWARTNSANEANELLNSVDFEDPAAKEAKPALLFARVFAQFVAGKKGLTRSALGELAALDPNLLGRFLAPKAQVHPGLQRLAREAFERTGTRQKQRPSVATGGQRRREGCWRP